MRLNLGCGLDQLAGWVNVDASDRLGPGVEVWDLDEQPWPFGDGTVTEIRAIDIYEHVDNPVGFMVECHRALAPGGLLRIQTCYWQHADAYTDPTHKRASTEYSFHYWIPGNILYDRQNPMMGGVAFEVSQAARFSPETGQLHVTLRRPTDA